MDACFSPYIPLMIFMYKYPSADMSPSIWYRSLMSGGKHFECILIYSDLDIGVSKKKYFRSQDINLPPLHSYESVLLKISFYSITYATCDDTSSGY